MTAPSNSQRHAMIERAVLVLGQRGESSVTLWTAMATVLNGVIGDQGFESLFFRCLHELASRHPWLTAQHHAATGAIEHLSAVLATRDADEAENVSAALLIIFTETLNLLIGEPVTNRILLSAWGTLAVDAVPEPSK